MMQKLLFIFVLAFTAISCQFTETMVMNEDGSGTMSVEVNLNEMMAFGGAAVTDSMKVKIDTIVYMKQFLEEKKDSISKLSASEQQKLKKLENFNIHMKMDSETSEMVYDISTQFKNVSEANDILSGLEQAGNLMPDQDANTEVKKEEDSPEVIGVNYSFKKDVFKRDAYIKDKIIKFLVCRTIWKVHGINLLELAMLDLVVIIKLLVLIILSGDRIMF